MSSGQLRLGRAATFNNCQMSPAPIRRAWRNWRKKEMHLKPLLFKASKTPSLPISLRSRHAKCRKTMYPASTWIPTKTSPECRLLTLIAGCCDHHGEIRDPLGDSGKQTRADVGSMGNTPARAE